MKFVTDTHCLLWHLENNPKLSPSGRALFDQLDVDRQIMIPIIVVAELMYMARKYGGPPFKETLDSLEKERRFEIMELTSPIIREAIPLTALEMHDALIVATARHLDLPLLTADKVIAASGLVQTLHP